jgi:hypothetical protein
MDVISIFISILALIVSGLMYRISKQNLALNAFIKAIEVWGSNEVREARRYIRKRFTDYTIEGDPDGEKVELQIKNGEQIELASQKVRVLSNEEQKHFEKVAVEADRVGFMLFEIKNLPKEFKKAFLEWLYDSFCTTWNKVAPHVNRERKSRNFVPYFEKLAYLGYNVSLKEKRNTKIIILDPEMMEKAFQKYKEWWDC